MRRTDKARLDFTTILHRINSRTRSSIQHGACPIIRPSVVAMMRTVIPPRSSTSTATSTQSAGKTESSFPFHRKRSSGTETTPTVEITSAHRRPVVSTRPIRCSASHWEAPREIYPGEWTDASPATLLCEVRATTQRKLSARTRHAPHLLRSRLLRGSLRKRRPASRESGESIMNHSRPTLWARPMARWPRSRPKHRKTPR